MYHYSRSQEQENMAHLVEVYANTLVKLTHDVELCYPYAKQDGQNIHEHHHELNQHMTALTLIIGAALSELANVKQVTPAALETLSALMPDEKMDPAQPSFSQSDLLKKVAERIGKFQTILNQVDPNPANMAKAKMSIKHEIDLCHGLMNDLKASQQWQHVELLANVNLLSDILERGIELSAKQSPKPRQ